MSPISDSHSDASDVLLLLVANVDPQTSCSHPYPTCLATFCNLLVFPLIKLSSNPDHNFRCHSTGFPSSHGFLAAYSRPHRRSLSIQKPLTDGYRLSTPFPSQTPSLSITYQTSLSLFRPAMAVADLSIHPNTELLSRMVTISPSFIQETPSLPYAQMALTPTSLLHILLPVECG